MAIQVPIKVFRYRPGTAPHFERYQVTVPDDATVIDVIEGVWAEHDRNFMFRHACHHASCGTCAVRLNGYERLPCIVPVTEALAGRQELVVEPLRNFPLVGDLVVDVAGFFQKQAASGLVITRAAEATLSGQPFAHSELFSQAGALEERAYNRFENCIECGICISACPTMAATDKFWGPAALAGIRRATLTTGDCQEKAALLALADSEQGVWRCHSAFECTESCPQDVDPGGAIMSLRREIVGRKVKHLFGAG
ncbi:MAG: 4Fe-4S dicluster domain-containing protein [Anaerolineales bacterium]|nr:4Fe-4S dicluster domain-containing protein [Anaerolineales bacterium]